MEGGKQSQIYVVRPDGTGLRQLTRFKAGTAVLSYSFSPDGKWIMFAKSGKGGEPDIFVMRANGTDIRPVTRTNTWDSAPDWEPPTSAGGVSNSLELDLIQACANLSAPERTEAGAKAPLQLGASLQRGQLPLDLERLVRFHARSVASPRSSGRRAVFRAGVNHPRAASR